MAEALLASFERVLAHPISKPHARAALVELACTASERARGAWFVLRAGGAAEVVAAHGFLTPPPDAVVRTARGLRAPCWAPGDPGGPSRADRLLVPVGVEGTAVLLLEGPRAEAPVGDRGLRLGAAIGRLIARGLEGIEEPRRERAPAALPTLREIERDHIVYVLATVRNKREASKVLGIAPSTLYEKLARYKIS